MEDKVEELYSDNLIHISAVNQLGWDIELHYSVYSGGSLAPAQRNAKILKVLADLRDSCEGAIETIQKRFGK